MNSTHWVWGLVLAGWIAASALPAAAQPASSNDVDRNFVAQAVPWHQEDLESADAQGTGADRSVRYFAAISIREDRLALSQLQALAEQDNLKYPTTVTPVARVPAKTYMERQVDYHRKAIALYEDEIARGGNQALRTYASHTLPTLKKHLAMAEEYVATGRIARPSVATSHG